MFLGRLGWTDDQIESTDDNENLITFAKKNPWDVRWCSTLSSWLERESLRTSLEDLYISFWILVHVTAWRPPEIFNGVITGLFQGIMQNWLALNEFDRRTRKTLLSVPDIGISNYLEMNPFIIESIFSIIQVLYIWATVIAAIQKFIFRMQWLHINVLSDLNKRG